MSSEKVNPTSLIGIRLLEERKRIGITQADAALLCGVSREMWNKYERAGAMPNSEVLVHLITNGVDVNYILGGSRVLSDESTLSEGERHVIQAYRTTDVDGKRSIERVASLEADRMKPRRKAG